MNALVRGWDGKAVGLTLAVLVLAAGFCVFDAGGHHEKDHAGFDLCLGMLVAVVSVTLISRLPLAGSADVDHFSPILEFSLRVPAPPPKSVLS
jgi:hypothetical protein